VVEVFFSGHGYWQYCYHPGTPSADDPPDVWMLTREGKHTGVFCLNGDDESVYTHAGSLDGITQLLPSIHTDSNFLRVLIEESPKDSYFMIDTSKEMILVLAKDVEIKTEDKMELSETEREKLLKQVGVLAILLSKKSNALGTSTGKPNVSQIAEAVLRELDTMPDANRKGLSNSNLRASISEGLELLNK
jgi:hypothetical protein